MRTRDEIKSDDVIRFDDDVIRLGDDVVKVDDAVQSDRESTDDADPESFARLSANDDDKTEEDQ